MSFVVDLILPIILLVGIFGGFVKFVAWGDRKIDQPIEVGSWIPSHIDGEEKEVICENKEDKI